MRRAAVKVEKSPLHEARCAHELERERNLPREVRREIGHRARAGRVVPRRRHLVEALPLVAEKAPQHLGEARGCRG